MGRMDYMEGKIESNIGFYIGDPCYVLDDNEYYGNWEKKYNFDDGEIKTDCGTWFVHSTAYGDGEYYDNNGASYGVDSGTLAVIPLEVVFAHPSEDIQTCGAITTDKMDFFGNTVIRNGRKLSCEIEVFACNFEITVKMLGENGEWSGIFNAVIETSDSDDEDEEDDDYWDDEDEDEEDDE